MRPDRVRPLSQVDSRERAALTDFRERAAAAEIGWLPPAEERLEFNEDVRHKSLGVTHDDWLHSLNGGQRIELVCFWFAGREADIPYEEWELPRPAWLGRNEA